MDFLEKIDDLMKKKGVTKSELAKGSGIPYTTIDSFYKKGFENTKLSTLNKLCDYFGVTLDYLARDTVTEPLYEPKDKKKLPVSEETERGSEEGPGDNPEDFLIDSFYTMFVKAGYIKNGDHLTNRQRMAVAGMINMIKAVFTIDDKDVAV